jgi:hypothetical protein
MPMGYKKPERRTASDWRYYFETVARMRQGRWSVHSRCETCAVTLKVSLTVIAASQGQAFSLWNRRPACTVEGCTGRRYYEAKPPGLAQWIRLQAPD